VLHIEDKEKDFFVVSRFDDIFRSVRTPKVFSSASGLTFEDDEIAKIGVPPTIVMMDAPQHTAFRRLIARGFTPKHITRLEEGIRAFVVDRVERLKRGEDTDLITSLAGPTPTQSLAMLMDIPESDYRHFDGWSNAIVQANADGSGIIHGAAIAVAQLFEYFTSLIAKRRADPGDDLITALAHAEVDNTRLTDFEIVGFCFVMIAGGNDTSTGLIGGAVELLQQYPEQQAMLREDPSLMPKAIEEFLRMTSPVQGLCRTTLEPVNIAGTNIEAGKKVMFLYGSGNRDEREFGDNAHELDIQREVPRHLSFTSGPHFCLGAALARMQGSIAIGELLTRIPSFNVDLDEAQLAPGYFVRRYERMPFEVRS
jgi:cytochrome P450